MDVRTWPLVLFIALTASGCFDGGAPTPDRGPPRLLDDTSTAFPEVPCDPHEKEIGWNARFYNVGGAGTVQLALEVNGTVVETVELKVDADGPGEAKLSWTPTWAGQYEVGLRWGTAGETDPKLRALAAPVTVGFPCWS